MATKRKHWAELVASESKTRIDQAAEAMRQVYASPALRRPNTSVLLEQAIAQPMDSSGREQLAKWARERYGDAAKFIFPYLGLTEEGTEVTE